jgi:hypothetical protein
LRHASGAQAGFSRWKASPAKRASLITCFDGNNLPMPQLTSSLVHAGAQSFAQTARQHGRPRAVGEPLVRAVLAYKPGKPLVCAMLKAPTPEEEDRRRLCRERTVMIVERVRHVNRVKGAAVFPGDIRLRASAPRPPEVKTKDCGSNFLDPRKGRPEGASNV